MNKEALNAAGIAIDTSNPKTGMDGGGPVQFVDFRTSATLRKLTRSDVLGNYIMGANALGGMPFKTNGIISHSFFRQSRLTFDFDAMRLVTYLWRAHEALQRLEGGGLLYLRPG